MVNFCWFEGKLWIFLPIAFFLIYLIFTFISATVEEYISGGITYISGTLGLSENMAAVTLLALANGAGDVVTAIVACKYLFYLNMKIIHKCLLLINNFDFKIS